LLSSGFCSITGVVLPTFANRFQDQNLLEMALARVMPAGRCSQTLKAWGAASCCKPDRACAAMIWDDLAGLGLLAHKKADAVSSAIHDPAYRPRHHQGDGITEISFG